MSTNEFLLDVQGRDGVGKSASRRLRRESGQVPAIIYGGEKEPKKVMVKHNELIKSLENEAFYSHIIRLNVDGVAEDVILKDLQRHPAKSQIIHVDFLRISGTRKLHMRVPLHFTNENVCKGVKLQGGTIYHSMTELEISCLPDALPEYIEVDLADVEVGQILHISDIKLPRGVESDALKQSADHDLPVVTVKQPKVSSSEDSIADVDGEEGVDVDQG